MGAACDMIEEVYPSILVGFLSGAISAYGFLRLAPMLKEKVYLSDTCGVLFLHGIPSIIGWLVSVFAAIGLKEESMNASPEV
jgi:ammonium transporter Rh